MSNAEDVAALMAKLVGELKATTDPDAVAMAERLTKAVAERDAARPAGPLCPTCGARFEKLMTTEWRHPAGDCEQSGTYGHIVLTESDPPAMTPVITDPDWFDVRSPPEAYGHRMCLRNVSPGCIAIASEYVSSDGGVGVSEEMRVTVAQLTWLRDRFNEILGEVPAKEYRIVEVDGGDQVQMMDDGKLLIRIDGLEVRIASQIVGYIAHCYGDAKTDL